MDNNVYPDTVEAYSCVIMKLYGVPSVVNFCTMTPRHRTGRFCALSVVLRRIQRETQSTFTQSVGPSHRSCVACCGVQVSRFSPKHARLFRYGLYRCFSPHARGVRVLFRYRECPSYASVRGIWQVYGIRGGFAGFYADSTPPVELTSKGVEMLQHKAGSVLGYACNRIGH